MLFIMSFVNAREVSDNKNIIITKDGFETTSKTVEKESHLEQTDDDVLLDQGFENITIPEGWQNIDYDGDGHYWEILSDGFPPHTGEYSIGSASYQSNTSTPLTPDNWLITPEINLTDYCNGKLTYWIAAQIDEWSQEHIEVWVSKTDTEITSFTDQIDVYTLPAGSDDYIKRIVDLSEYSGEIIYLAFRHCDVTDMFWIKLDDIEITAQYVDPSHYSMVISNDRIEAGTQTYDFSVYGKFQDEIFAYAVNIWLLFDSPPNPMSLVNVSIDGCVGEGAEYFWWTKTVYAYSLRIQSTIWYTYNLTAGNGIPAGEGLLVKYIFNVSSDIQPQIISVIDDVLSYSYYYKLTPPIHPSVDFVEAELEIISPNLPPEIPDIPQGPSEGIPEEEYEFNTTVPEDPEGNDVYVMWAWGDETYSEWLGPFSPGHIERTMHSYEQIGEYHIKVKAKDMYDAESSWSQAHIINIEEPAEPELVIESITGGKGLSFIISNVGDADAADVHAVITITGGLFVTPREFVFDYDEITAGSSEDIQISVFGIGLGFLTQIPVIAIRIEATNLDPFEESINARIIGRNVMLT